MTHTPIDSSDEARAERGPRRWAGARRSPGALAAALLGSALVFSICVDGASVATASAADLPQAGSALAAPEAELSPLASPSASPTPSPDPLSPMSPGKVAIGGTMVKSRTVKAKLSGWSPKPATVTYRWLAGGKPIAGATGRTLKIPAAAVGKRLKVEVTASAPGYETTTKTSAATKPVNRVAIDPRCLTRGRVICADKNRRKVYQVQDGLILDSFDARFGMAGLRTRNGEWTIDDRNPNAYSHLYKVWMPFAQFFSGSQGVHYSADFAAHGYGIGSHGCVNLRDYDGAKKLYAWAELGDKVVVYGEDR